MRLRYSGTRGYTPARVLMAYAADERWIGFLIERDRTFLAVNLAGDEIGPFRTQEAAVAALSRERGSLNVPVGHNWSEQRRNG